MNVNHKIETRINFDRHDMVTVFGTAGGYPRKAGFVHVSMHENGDRLTVEMSPEQARELAENLTRAAREAEEAIANAIANAS